MLGVTLFGIFLTPVFFNVIQWFTDRRAIRRSTSPREDDAASANGDGHPHQSHHDGAAAEPIEAGMH
jgi:hypothetical protein